MNNWIIAGNLEDIPRTGARIIKTPETKIAVFRTAQDELFALKDRCPHKDGPLSQGIVCGNRVTCPLHNFVIDLSEGKAVAPDEGAVPRYPVKLAGDKVLLCLQEITE